ncbi:alpha/beta-hydrolase [Dichomitus squalens]|uniref:Alpha/beta-hydrolase n=1 Tax=Dichomitus squalens TaxID=114155 RepID=A0A4Q9Q5H2_9APHY|nr:alpha/beta-hydrolase [Dichomitus squalens]
MAAPTQVKTVTVDGGVEVFYREAVPASASAADPSALPVVLLLHGFPASSFQYRNLIPVLAARYRVLAPDLPGYGFTAIPAARAYEYTFAALADTVAAFLDALAITEFAVYVFDYGAPTAFRLALQRPKAIKAIVSQNGNAYEDGFGEDFWAPVKKAWADPSEENLAALEKVTSLEVTKWQYTNGAPDPSAVPPETYHLDYYLMTRPGNAAIQLKLLLDYGTNVRLYPEFHKYFREHQPPVLAVWGKNDAIFVPPGAEAFKRDNANVTVKLVDAGHFALESALEEIDKEILNFFEKHGI